MMRLVLRVSHYLTVVVDLLSVLDFSQLVGHFSEVKALVFVVLPVVQVSLEAPRDLLQQVRCFLLIQMVVEVQRF